MKRLILPALIATGLALLQTSSITVWPQGNGDTCYTFGLALSCVPGGIGMTVIAPTEVTRSVTTTKTPVETPTATQTATAIPNTPTATQTPTRAALAPSATPVPPLLVNADFEQPDHAGWTAFNRYRDIPQFNDERGDPRSRHGGAQSLRIWNEFRCHLSGVYQQVSVTRFETYRFSVWGRTWASDSSSFDTPSDLNVFDGVAVGIDPSGGTNPGSTGVIWSEADNTENWRRVEVQVTALSNRIAVFVQTRLGVLDPSSNACNWPKPFLMGFIDSAALELVP